MKDRKEHGSFCMRVLLKTQVHVNKSLKILESSNSTVGEKKIHLREGVSGDMVYTVWVTASRQAGYSLPPPPLLHCHKITLAPALWPFTPPFLSLPLTPVLDKQSWTNSLIQCWQWKHSEWGWEIRETPARRWTHSLCAWNRWLLAQQQKPHFP